jgi:CDP-2,3-bis-(O-geranylgeranyl)-sn-glycerol synthase
MINLIVQSLYFFLPAYVSNMAPVALNKLNPLKRPIDFGMKLHGKPLFGKNKTWGGLVLAIICGTLMFYYQQQTPILFFKRIAIIPYAQQPLLFGFLLASGAIIGDLFKSFVKRRWGKKSGAHWFPFDQLDYAIGALVFLSPLYIPPIKIIITLLILAPVLHYITNYLGFLLGLKPVKW